MNRRRIPVRPGMPPYPEADQDRAMKGIDLGQSDRCASESALLNARG